MYNNCFKQHISLTTEPNLMIFLWNALCMKLSKLLKEQNSMQNSGFHDKRKQNNLFMETIWPTALIFGMENCLVDPCKDYSICTYKSKSSHCLRGMP